MRIRVSLAAAACWLIALASPGLRGSTVVELTATQLFSGASTILVGTATGQSTYRDSANVWTATTFAVSEVLKGAPTSQYTLRQYGGVIGNTGYAAAGLATVRVGQQYLLVLDDTASVTAIRGLFQGLFQIQGSAVSDAFGRSLYWQGVDAPLGRGQAPARGASRSSGSGRPESYSSLRARILALVQGTPQPEETGSASADSTTPQYDGLPFGDFTLEECVPGSGNPVKGWQNGQLQLESLANLADAGTGANWLDALSAAIANWNTVTSAFQIGLTAGGSSTPGTPADGRNTVGFSSTMQGGMPWTTGTLGITYFTYVTASCYITQASIFINATMPFATDGSTNGYDFQSVVGHEIGHSFGLDHPNGLTPAAIMLTGVLFPGAAIRVQQSDQDGTIYLYTGALPPALPQLVVTSLETAPTAVLGGSLPVTQATVQNEGAAVAGPFEIGFYLSAGASISTSSLKGGSCQVPGLPAGEAFTCTASLAVPGSLSPGSYLVGAIADDLGQVTQSNRAGNTLLANSGPVVLTQADGPDLVITALDSVGSGQTSSGQTVGTLPVSQLSVQNLGSVAGAFSVAVYFSTTSTISASDTYSGFSCSFTSLASGSTVTCSGTITVPGALIAGTYYLGAMVSTNDNTRTADTGVVTLASGNTPQIATGGIVNAASYAGPAVAPGGIAALFGSRLSNVSGIVGAAQIPLPTSISGVSVLVTGTNGTIAAPLFAVSNSSGVEQINFQVPWELAGQTSAQVVVQNNGVNSAPVQVSVLPAQPGIFTLDGVNGVFVDPISGNVISAQNPAEPNQILTLYANSLGPVTNQPTDGNASPGALSPPATTITTPGVTVAGISSPSVAFSGMTPTLVGLYQINFQVPLNAPSGNLPVTVEIAGQTSAAAMIAVQAPTF